MKFYTKQHKHYCGIDLHARNLYVCILDQGGNILIQKNIKANPQALMALITPYRDDLVIGVCIVFATVRRDAGSCLPGLRVSSQQAQP